MRRTFAILLIFSLLFFSMPAFAAPASPPYLAVSGAKDGQVFSVNQKISVSPEWRDGRPEYLGGTIEYLWSPENSIVSRDGSSAVFQVPNRQDSFDMFVSAEMTGLGSWISPSELSQRVGSAHVVIAALSDARSPSENYTDEKAIPRAVVPGHRFELSAQWRGANGRPAAEAPHGIRYEWTVTTDGSRFETLDANGPTAIFTAPQTGVYKYTCSAYPEGEEGAAALCAVQFPVTVTNEPEHAFSVSTAPEAVNGIVHIAPGESVSLNAVVEPPVSGASYTWQRLNSEGVWEDVQNASTAEYVFYAASVSPGTSEFFRCLGTSSEWAAEAGPVNIEIMNPAYSFEQAPYDVGAPEGDGNLQMSAVVSHPEGAQISARWQYRANGSAVWEDAKDAVPEFVEKPSVMLSSSLTAFTWVPNGADTSQNGEYRLVCGGTSSSPALLTVFPAGGAEFAPAEPLEVRLQDNVGQIFTGLCAAPAARTHTVSDLIAEAGAPSGYSVRVLRNARTMEPGETVGTGCLLVLTAPDSSTEDAACVVMRGDVLGTGTVGLTQLVRLAQAYSDSDGRPLFGPYLAAADFDGNGRIDLSDLAGMAQLMMEEDSLTRR